MVPAQNLMSPTKKDFEHLVAFLLRQLDPHWRLLGKLEDEVPAMLAWLKYPFQARRELFMTTGVRGQSHAQTCSRLVLLSRRDLLT